MNKGRCNLKKHSDSLCDDSHEIHTMTPEPKYLAKLEATISSFPHISADDNELTHIQLLAPSTMVNSWQVPETRRRWLNRRE